MHKNPETLGLEKKLNKKTKKSLKLNDQTMSRCLSYDIISAKNVNHSQMKGNFRHFKSMKNTRLPH